MLARVGVAIVPRVRPTIPLALAFLCAGAAADEPRTAQDPTGGLLLPMTPLAGDLDATTATVNPAGSPFLGGWHLAAAFTGLDRDRAPGVGEGVGGYYAAPVAVPLLPRFGVGLAAEQIEPPRSSLFPDPGKPLRLTASLAYAPAKDVAFGVGWHHFVDENDGAVAGLDTFDLGVSAKIGANLAAGLVVRDLFAPRVAGFQLARIWDGEVTVRPFGTDALEVAAGVAIAEHRETVDPRLRLGVRVVPGLWLRAAGELLTRIEVDDTGSELDRKLEVRASAGIEVSLGSFGVGGYAIGTAGDLGNRVEGGMGIVRLSSERIPTLVPSGEHLERVKIKGDPDERELTAILAEMRRIERDEKVRGVFLQLDNLGGGWASLQELRAGIAKIRAHGKKVFTYIVAGSTKDYYLAAAGDRIYLDAAGGLRILGMSSSVMFFKDVFEKLGVDAQFEKIAEYKSAPEAFTMDQSSPEARTMREEMLDDLWGRLVTDLAHDRGKSRADIEKMFEDGPYTAGDALATKIVDAVVEPTDLDGLISAETGGIIALEDRPAPERNASWARPQIAVIYLDGDIVDGKSTEVPFIGEKVAGAETIGASIAWARENPRVEAIVLRVNSPGGSALASDLIAREMFQTRGKKPLVVSIGDIAASGGYFAAAPGDIIYAEPAAITGSIGIFSGKFDLSELLGKIGITFETLRRGSHADMESYLRPYSAEERTRLKEKLRYFYMRFVGAVARGRGMTEDRVDAVGRGHVWTGAQGRENGLIDAFGGLMDAVGEAKRRAGMSVDDVAEIVMLPAEPPSLVARLLGLAGAAENDLALPGADSLRSGPPEIAGAPLPIPALGATPAVLDTAARELLRLVPASILLDPTGVQARLPYVLTE